MPVLPRLSALRLTTLFLQLAPLWIGTAAIAGEIKAPLLACDPSREDILRAHEILRAWDQAEPKQSGRSMKIVYWTPADRDPQPEYRARLTRVMKHIQQFYQSQMDSYGFPHHTIRLDLEPDGSLHIPIAKGTLKSAECNEQDQSIGHKIRKDCLDALKKEGIDGEKETIVIFCNLADWDAEKRTMGHHSPYYASGNSTGGTAWQVDSPLLDSAVLGVTDQFLTDRQYGRISLGKYNSIFVGGVCHELGHALGLPHCRECAEAAAKRGTALMGSGNRTYGEELRNESKGSFLTLPHALKLAAHPQFSGSVKEMQTPAKVTFSNWKFHSTEKGLDITGKLESNLPCHAVLVYGDPDGGADYDAAVSAGIPRPDGSFSVLLPPARTKSKPGMLNFVGVCANGAATASVWSAQAFTLPCRIDDKGLYDVSTTVTALEISTNLESARKGTLTKAQLDALSPVARECLRRISLPDSSAGKPSAGQIPQEIRQTALSDCAATKASTGYGGVHFDRTDGGTPLIGPDGPAAHGLWAHANSTFSYDLSGKWRTFEGRCGMLATGKAVVKASIQLDGKTVWQSGEIQPGSLKPFQVDVSNASTMTLTIEGTKGISFAHAAWIEPVLKR